MITENRLLEIETRVLDMIEAGGGRAHLTKQPDIWLNTREEVSAGIQIAMKARREGNFFKKIEFGARNNTSSLRGQAASYVRSYAPAE